MVSTGGMSPETRQRLQLFDSSRDVAPADLEEELRKNVLLTSVDQVMNWARSSSLWPGDVRPRLLRHRDDRQRDLAL